MNRTRLYREGRLVDEDFPASELSERLAADGRAVAWLDLCQPTPGDVHLLTEELGLHRLAVEDALQRRQRAKLDRYETHIFLSAYAVRTGDGNGLALSEISTFVTARALITVREEDFFDVGDLTGRWDENADLSVHGVAFLLHGLLDLLVDNHLAVISQLDSSVERLEDLVFEERGPLTFDAQRRTFAARRDLVRLRQVLLPMREVANEVIRPSLRIIDAEMLAYYQDLYDHVLRTIEWSEALRDLCATVLETHLTVQSNQQNVIMKKVTSWAAIIAVPTAITSFFGQNLPIPGRERPITFVVSSVVSLGVAIYLFVVLRRKDWL